MHCNVCKTDRFTKISPRLQPDLNSVEPAGSEVFFRPECHKWQFQSRCQSLLCVSLDYFSSSTPLFNKILVHNSITKAVLLQVIFFKKALYYASYLKLREYKAKGVTRLAKKSCPLLRFYTASSACFRSPIRSSASSIPTDSRSVSSKTPARSRSSLD